MTENYDAIKAKLPPMFLAFLPHVAGGCSEERAKSASAFFAEPVHAAPGTDKEMAKVAEAVRDCASLRSREGGAVAAYLRRPSAHLTRGSGSQGPGDSYCLRWGSIVASSLAILGRLVGLSPGPVEGHQTLQRVPGLQACCPVLASRTG